MKKIMAAAAPILIFIMALCFINYTESHYERTGYVSYIDDCTDIITITDTTGNMWDVNVDTECYNKNDKVILKMYTNFTDFNITDDEVIDIERRN